MKHIFINFLLDIFFILPNWTLKALTLRKEITYKNEVFDYQSMTYISLISWIITKLRLALDMADFSNEMREKMSNFRMKINNSKLPKQIIHKEDQANQEAMSKVKELLWSSQVLNQWINEKGKIFNSLLEN